MTVASPLLLTKLYLPPTPPTHLPRPELIRLLDTAATRKLVLVAAGAGFGKTSLVAQWGHTRPDVCWLSLDAHDNDPVRFLSYVIAALQTRLPNFGSELLAALHSPQPPALNHALASLINQLAAQPVHYHLILDDYHYIENTQVHEAVIFLLENLPLQLTLWLLTRVDPPLPIAKLRAEKNLLELRATDLRLSPAETQIFFNQTSPHPLTPATIQTLEARTEGWLTGLQLAALALANTTGPAHAEEFVQHFNGSHRFILDYLIEEVLAHQPPATRDFLLHTSILQRLTGELCNALTQTSYGQTTLAELERRNLFLVPLDNSRTWYRYHHLFAELLRARLLAEQPHIVKELNWRAAKWFAAHDAPIEAVDYALTAEAYTYAAELISRNAASAVHQGEIVTLLRWYRAFPPQFVAQYPMLCLYFGIAFAFGGQWAEAQTLLTYLQQHAHPPEETLWLTYLLASYQNDSAQLAALAEQARQHKSNNPLTQITLGLVVSAAGKLNEASDLMAQAQATSEQTQNTSLALTALFHQCRLSVYSGELQKAFSLSQQALQQIKNIGGAALALASLAHATLCRVGIEWRDLATAESHAYEALRLSESTGLVAGMMSSVTMMLAEVKQAQGESVAALSLAEQALTFATRYDPPLEVLWLKTYQARLALTQGHIELADRWWRETQGVVLPASIFYPQRIVAVTTARLWLAQRKLPEAIDLLTQLSAAPLDLLSVEVLALLALARQAQGDANHAVLALEQAIRLAQPEKRWQVFLNLGTPMQKLWSRLPPTAGAELAAAHAWAATPSERVEIESIGEREREVWRLIVAGHSNEEIAQKLSLALSTVKWYINVLYGKLGVKNRAQAIRKAQELNLN